MPIIEEAACQLEAGLTAAEVDRRLLALAREHNRLEAALCFYLKEMQQRQLYVSFGFSSTVDYARERLGFEDRKTRSLLYMAERFQSLPEIGQAFAQGELAWTKVREVVKVAQPETESLWLEKCRNLSNRQLEQEVRQSLPPVRKKTLVVVLEGELVDTWEQAREAAQRLAGKNLTDMEFIEVMMAEILCTYATTPALGPTGEEAAGGFAGDILERDGWQCTRPGCTCRVGLQGHHLEPRSQGGSDDPANRTVVCAICHSAVTRGVVKVSGRAPDHLVWEGPWGLIEKPLPLPARGAAEEKAGEDRGPGKGEPPKPNGDSLGSEAEDGLTASLVREVGPTYEYCGRCPGGVDHVIQAHLTLGCGGRVQWSGRGFEPSAQEGRARQIGGGNPCPDEQEPSPGSGLRQLAQTEAARHLPPVGRRGYWLPTRRTSKAPNAG